MPVCDASSIVFDGRALAWFGAQGATWSVAADRLRAIREYVAGSGDVRWLVAFDIDGEDAGLQSPPTPTGWARRWLP